MAQLTPRASGAPCSPSPGSGLTTLELFIAGGERLGSHEELETLLYPLGVIFLVQIPERLGVSLEGKIPAGHMASGDHVCISNPALGESMRTELISRGHPDSCAGGCPRGEVPPDCPLPLVSAPPQGPQTYFLWGPWFEQEEASLCHQRQSLAGGITALMTPYLLPRVGVLQIPLQPPGETEAGRGSQ